MAATAEILGLIRRLFSGIRNYGEWKVNMEDLLIALILAGLAVCIISFFIGLLNKRTRRIWLIASLLGFIAASISFFLFPLPENPSPPAPVPSPAYKAPTKPKYQIKQRKKIFLELVRAEDKAHIEALRKYPNDIHKLRQYMEKLEERYKKQVRDKYGITKEQTDRISVEGETKNWPAPQIP